jgi:predicted acylesterase/phospholipase RssA
MSKDLKVNSVVFAGGGCRCFWQLGFWNVAAPALKLKPKVFAGVSAGAAMAVTIAAGRSEFLLEYFKKTTGENKKNFYPENFFSGKPMFPQNEMYRDAVITTLKGGYIRNVKSGPEIKILIARPPVWLGARTATIVGLGTYSIEKKLFFPVHSNLPTRLGYKAEVVSVKDCNTEEELVDLILQSSCTPPLVPILRRDNKVALDGGLVDNVPVSILDESEKKDVLLFLTRRYPEDKIPVVPGWTYLQPSEDIPIVKWDYSNPDGLQKTFDLGRKDGEAFVEKIKKKK